MEDDKNENEEDIFTKDIVDTTREESKDIVRTKKGLLSVLIAIILIFISVAIILYFIFKTHMDEINYIKAKYKKSPYNLIFHHSYLDSVEKILVNNVEITKNNNISFEENEEITIKFNTNLKSLDNLFYECDTLEEIDLSFLTTDDVINAAYMFYGCNNLKNIIFGDFITTNLYNISNMFSGCEKLDYIDVDIFNNDRIEDISGLFFGCSKLEKINLGAFNTKNVVNMSKLFSGCSSLSSLNIPQTLSFSETRVTSYDIPCSAQPADEE